MTTEICPACHGINDGGPDCPLCGGVGCRPAQSVLPSDELDYLPLWSALRDACRATHSGRPGGAAMCVCGAAVGGSSACAMLGILRSFFQYAEEDLVAPSLRESLRRIKRAIH